VDNSTRERNARTANAAADSFEARLERGEVIAFPQAPFALPQSDDLAFLMQQESGGLSHKNISYNPETGKTTGFVRQGDVQADRLRDLLAAFSRAVSGWVALALPAYHSPVGQARVSGCQADRASFRPEEEATRRLRQTARNDLLHIDAYPNRPSWGRRILRVYANVNPTESRVWAMSESFPQLLRRFGSAVGLPTGQRQEGSTWLEHLGQGVLNLFRAGQPRRSEYDAFMLRLHDFLKKNDAYQERAPKKLWTFPPGSAWMTFTDGCAYAELRGRYALEHSFFIDQHVLILPDESPASLLAVAASSTRSDQAA
jgi:3-deoxy-D-manno-oct-2-ulosonic acid (Kdo) hydroxylase